ncbi:hypothetical protein SCORR_v1c05110 [Spiroplasma corruscae]|uniref:Uncharacterized protein n=1 Tax=Spiroplasma corruscae TaxID=216934 RepID=A0A222EPR1_9MOLU|nr:hypothetical protein [Spiroplasma corruscae]ASP28283.1 hypothetical protein SCORR_v1c05110 [Spiroplasma corruscae]
MSYYEMVIFQYLENNKILNDDKSTINKIILSEKDINIDNLGD